MQNVWILLIVTPQEENMDKPMANIAFRGMSFSYKARDFFRPRDVILENVPFKPGQAVLDFGCGPGSYVFHVLKKIGKTGKIFALDIHPLAIQHVEEKVKRRNIDNVFTILSDCETGLEDTSVDIILLYDIFHMFNNPNKILRELYRVLKVDGCLSVHDHHMSVETIIAGITNPGLFNVEHSGDFVVNFKKISN